MADFNPVATDCSCTSVDPATDIVRRIHATAPGVVVVRVSPDCPQHAVPWPYCEPPAEKDQEHDEAVAPVPVEAAGPFRRLPMSPDLDPAVSTIARTLHELYCPGYPNAGASSHLDQAQIVLTAAAPLIRAQERAAVRAGLLRQVDLSTAG